MGSTIEYARPDGAKAHGYLADSAGAGAPGVVMLEEWWGVNDQMRETADRLAGDGFRVIVADLFHGKVAINREDAGHMVQGLDFGAAATQEAPAAAAALRGMGSSKVGVMGFCMGGAVALLSAMHSPGTFDAVVTFYGNPPPEAGDPSKIAIPVLGNWAIQDEFFTGDAVDALESKLKAGAVSYEFHRYDAKHGFYNPAGLGNYHREAAETAWKRTVEFFRRTLR